MSIGSCLTFKPEILAPAACTIVLVHQARAARSQDQIGDETCTTSSGKSAFNSSRTRVRISPSRFCPGHSASGVSTATEASSPIPQMVSTGLASTSFRSPVWNSLRRSPLFCRNFSKLTRYTMSCFYASHSASLKFLTRRPKAFCRPGSTASMINSAVSRSSKSKALRYIMACSAVTKLRSSNSNSECCHWLKGPDQ